jgi:hypothetical protein
MSLPVTVYPRLSLRVRRDRRWLRVSARGGTGTLLYVRWHVGRRWVYARRLRLPRGSATAEVSGVDGTGTLAAARLRYAHGRLRWVHALSPAASPLEAAPVPGAGCPR